MTVACAGVAPSGGCDDVEIRSGGAIAVDTESLRRAAGALSALCGACDDVREVLRRAWFEAGQAGALLADPLGPVDEARDSAARLAAAVRRQADIYEEVERQLAREGGIVASPVERFAARGVDPETVTAAEKVLAQWRADRTAVFDDELRAALFPYLAYLSPLLVMLDATVVLGLLGLGRISPAQTMRFGDDLPASVRDLARIPATVRELSRTEVAAPLTLADIAERIPDAGDERVRVEVYTGADGRRQYAVYIAGTRDWGLVTDEPSDLLSNLELYLGIEAASYEAAEQALSAAGARPGDTVHLAGHSQGAMVATWLARAADYEVASLITFGSPVAAELDEGVFTVAVRHLDDPVVALAAGGAPGVVGSSDSFVVDRVVDPALRPGDLRLGTVHAMTEYVDTAARADASGDPRMDALRVTLGGLGAATATAISYSTQRAEPSVSGQRSNGVARDAPGVSGASSSAAGGGRSRTPN